MENRKNEINFPTFANWGVRFDEIVFLLWYNTDNSINHLSEKKIKEEIL